MILSAPFTRERDRSTSFRIAPKSGTLKGCVHTTLEVEPFRCKNWNDQTRDTINGAIRNHSVRFPFEQANGKHVNGTIAFQSEHKAILLRSRSVPV